MPRPRHARLAILALTGAVAVAAALAIAPGAVQMPARVPVGVEDVVAAPAPSPSPRTEAWAPRPDPDGPRGETGVLRPPSPAALTGYVWPLPKGRLTLPFERSGWGSRLVDGEPFHDGIDLATFCGDRIVAAHDGVVLAAGRRYDRFMGWQGDLQPYFDRLDEKQAWGSLPIVVVIDDGNGYRSLYAHFSKVAVGPGQRVTAGEFIGHEGRTGRASGCHLHYGLFSPLETAVFGIRGDLVEKLLLPPFQTARIDPLLVLPPRGPEDPTQDGIRPTARPATALPPVSPVPED